MALKEYSAKRKFEDTPEPNAAKKTKKKSTGLRFVVQRHHASRLHYDFRLEMDGVLKSWAVPKGPSLNPKDKRLAMMVEDHPYAYRTFEGNIPKGNYGAGTVTIFDEGTYESLAEHRKDDEKTLKQGLASGNLKIKLIGDRLKGEFALVKIKSDDGNAWLLIKHKDEFAVSKKFDAEDLIEDKVKKEGLTFKETDADENVEPTKPQTLLPMLAKLGKEVFDNKQWIYEKKLDGYRIIAEVGDAVKLNTRRGKDYTTNYPIISSSLTGIKEKGILDGEIVAEDKAGKDGFQLLQNYETSSKANLKYYVFDLLYLDGHDITHLPLLKRKELLKNLLNKYQLENVLYNDHIKQFGKQLFEEAEEKKWEGIIAKQSDSEYFAGQRSENWLKFKKRASIEAVICGFTPPAGSRKYFGALILGIYENGILTYVGNCGTGFNNVSLKIIHQEMEKLITTNKPFKTLTNQEKGATWLEPKLICEVFYHEFTETGSLRHPVFKGLRDDKEIHNITMEEQAKPEENEKDLVLDKKPVHLSNLNKVYWPEEKITKGELLAYYEEMADYILPYLKDKPLSLNRHPNGINAPSFYQKNIDVDNLPKWAKTVEVHSESTDKEINYLICNDKATLLYAVNLGCIEINPWLSTYKKPENPEYLVIDLDPDDNDFQEIINIALLFKSTFDELGIKSYVKTSGSSGIHIYVYIGAKYDYDFVKDFAEFVAQLVHEKSPDNTSIERSLSKRKGLIYLDFLQNRRGQTIACPFSVRPKPGATVSMLLSWDMLNEDLDMSDYTIKNVPLLVKNYNDPWKEIKDEIADLKKALSKLKK